MLARRTLDAVELSLRGFWGFLAGRLKPVHDGSPRRFIYAVFAGLLPSLRLEICCKLQYNSR